MACQMNVERLLHFCIDPEATETESVGESAEEDEALMRMNS